MPTLVRYAVQRRDLPARVGAFFGADDPWERPRPPVGRQDVLLAAAVAVVGLASLELVRSVGALDQVGYPWAVQWLAVRRPGPPSSSAAVAGRWPSPPSPRPTCSSSA